MARRETNLRSDLQQWRGVDQRTQPTLVKSGFFVMARGVFFGLGNNAERLPGKTLTLKSASPIFSITVFGELAFVQTLDNLYSIPLAEIFDPSYVPVSFVTVGGITVTVSGAPVTV